ncbi:MAG TPA: OsmC family protein [Fimbriimonadaceae bacterium]|nr:OsmC family protein [Fimbriimonadaceae bacterium]
MSHVHEYPVSVQWAGGRAGGGTATPNRSGHALKLSVPPEFQGPGEGTNPEELLTAAIASCYSITFGIIAENRKIPVTSFQAEATGEVEQNGAQFVYKAITIRPNIVLDSDATDDQVKAAEDMAHKADLYCIITNAVRDKVAITVEPSVRRG